MYSFRSISACPKQVNANRLDSSISFVLTIYDQPAALAFRLRPGMATNYKFATILPRLEFNKLVSKESTL